MVHGGITKMVNRSKIDSSLYGRNKKGKISLCETCAYVGYCLKTLKFYKCKDYIKGSRELTKYGYLHEQIETDKETD